MNIRKLNNAVQKPKVYEKGDSVMWTDAHISKQLLKLHLNSEIDAASRTPKSINNTIDFLLNLCNKPQMEILDLGCGPGIYTEKLAEKGHRLTGMDFSENSISYATDQAQIKNLNINYVCQDYLTLDYSNQFDLVILIYTDFGVLLPDERNIMLENISKALKPNGLFVFDVINDKGIDQKFQELQTWTSANSGFWKDRPYLELASGYNYPNENVFLKQHALIDESEKINVYRFWVHYFNTDVLIEMLSNRDFNNIEHYENILPATNIWDGENVTFYKAEKR